MRLDKYISDNTNYSRSDAKRFIKSKRVYINGVPNQDPGFKVTNDMKIEFNHKEIKESGFIYFELDKPKGYVSAVSDKEHPVVTDLIPEELKHLNLKPVGRLDKDTTGLIILTNDDSFIHQMTSPKNNVIKTYIVALADPIKDEYKQAIEAGIELKDGTVTKPGKYKVISDNVVELTITEGKYHQVKRMFGALGNKVVELRRIQFGDYKIKST